jgi:hypothetical protein
MVATIGILFTVGLMSIAAFAAADGDYRLGAEDKERKGAYAAAEAGVNDYLSRLVAKPDYWRDCATDTTNNASINGHNPGAARRWATVPGATSQYSVELLPANNQAQCTTADPVGTFIDTDTGTFRIRSTGRASAGSSVRRSVIATFRRRGFLDYIYFTDLETNDPIWYTRSYPRETRENGRLGPGGTIRNIVKWAEMECDYYRDGRGTAQFIGNDEHIDPLGAPHPRGYRRTDGVIGNESGWDDISENCDEIRFVGSATTKDYVNGPLHSNDELLVCGTPHFGRRASDTIEVSAPVVNNDIATSGWRGDPSCAGNQPEVNMPGQTTSDRGTWVPNSPIVSLPPNNATLRDDALPAYRFKGLVRITMNGTTMTVTGMRESGAMLTGVTMPMPKDGVIYIADDPALGSCAGYQPANPNVSQPACGDARIRGTYEKSVTITAENDIVIEEDVTATGSNKPLLGLISTKWIRVYHPVDGSCNNSGGPGAITIEAAILSLQHSFTVDHYWCGAKLGNLNVTGAIGQKYRGPVGTGSATTGSGYIKNYNYNDDLRFRSPPRFLDPVQTTWKLRSQVEQVPAAP